MDCVQGSDLTTKGLHDKGRHGVADIPGAAMSAAWLVARLGDLVDSPVDHLQRSSQHETTEEAAGMSSPTWLAMARTLVSGTGRSVDMVL